MYMHLCHTYPHAQICRDTDVYVMSAGSRYIYAHCIMYMYMYTHMQVAFTRPRSGLIVLGNPDTLSRDYETWARCVFVSEREIERERERERERRRRRRRREREPERKRESVWVCTRARGRTHLVTDIRIPQSMC